MAEIPVEIELRQQSKTPVYQRIAPEAARLHEGGLTLKAVAEHFAVDDHTVAKAVRWFRQRWPLVQHVDRNALFWWLCRAPAL